MQLSAKNALLFVPLMTAALLTLAACGQTGPLYFDEAPPADQLPPSKKSAPINTVPQTMNEKPADKKNAPPP